MLYLHVCRCREIDYPPRQDNPFKPKSMGGYFCDVWNVSPLINFMRGDTFRTLQKYPPQVLMVLRGGILFAWSETDSSLDSTQEHKCNKKEWIILCQNVELNQCSEQTHRCQMNRCLQSVLKIDTSSISAKTRHIVAKRIDAFNQC